MHGPKCKLGEYCTVGRRIQEVNVVGGLILPIWGTIEKALSKQVKRLVHNFLDSLSLSLSVGGETYSVSFRLFCRPVKATREFELYA